MKTVTHIETVGELRQALTKTRQEGDSFPILQEVHLIIDHDGFQLTTKDPSFNINSVPVIEFLNTVLKEEDILLTINIPQNL